MWGKRQRRAWEASLSWFRVHYCDAKRTAKALALLSASDAAGRVALRFAPASQTALATLFIGVGSHVCPLLEKMALHFDFMITQQDMTEHMQLSFAAVRKLDWRSAFEAHLVNGFLFASNCADADKRSLFPQMKDHDVLSYGLHLPALPQAGLSRTPRWLGAPVPLSLLGSAEGNRWPLGISAEKQPLSIVVDGHGDLVPQLKRNAAVTRRLNKGIRYIDLDSNALPTGFNPLAKVTAETASARLQRWQAWFASMNVHAACYPLLAGALKDAVGTLPELRTWLSNRERRTQQIAVAILQTALNNLMAEPTLREWLEWPSEHIPLFQEGSFFFCCQANTSARRSLLHGVLLAALATPQHRIVLHGVPLNNVDLGVSKHLVVSNYSTTDYDSAVLVKRETTDANPHVYSMLRENAQLRENICLLQRGEGVIINDTNAFFTTWDEGVGEQNG